MRVEHARRGQPELEDLVAADHRVAGVVATLVAHDHRDLLGQEVGRLALALVAPLQPDDHGGRHQQASHQARRRTENRRSGRSRRRRPVSTRSERTPRCVSERRSRPTRASAVQGAARIKDPRPSRSGGWIDMLRRDCGRSGRSDASRDGRCALKARSLTSWFAGTRSCRGRPEYSRATTPEPTRQRPMSTTPDQRGPYFRHARQVRPVGPTEPAPTRSLLGVMRLLGVLAIAAPVAVALLFLTNPGLTSWWVAGGDPAIVAGVDRGDRRRRPDGSAVLDHLPDPLRAARVRPPSGSSPATTPSPSRIAAVASRPASGTPSTASPPPSPTPTTGRRSTA